ncbi:MAG: hypothetical protein J6W05_08690 [Prevotella sp.]|nr:hypothetical protein [Prevotella sp.]
MQICDKQSQSLNISASPSFATAQGRENERRDWTEETYQAKNKQPGNRSGTRCFTMRSVTNGG